MQVNTLIFSKNRACQLELLLRNLNIPVTVLYTYDPVFKPGYDKLIPLYPSAKFIKETDFKSDLLKSINEGSDYVMFLVDDDVMIRPFYEDSPEFLEFKNNPDIICLSMRLSPDYRFRGKPDIKNNTWEWKRYARGSLEFHEYLRIWGYPMAVGAHLFRKEDVLASLALAKEIKSPGHLESSLNLKMPNRSLIKCFDKPKFVNNEANQVQTGFRPSSTVGIHPKELEKRFLLGERISLTDIIEKAANVRDYFMKTEYKWETQ